MTAQSLQMLLALALGFAVAGLCSSGLPACHQPPAELQSAHRRAQPVGLAAVPVLMVAAPFLIMRNTFAAAGGRPPLRIRVPGHADCRLLEPDVGHGGGDDAGGLRPAVRLSRSPLNLRSCNVRRP